MNTPAIVTIAIIAYLVGSINASAIAAAIAGIGDIRGQGRGNLGATNLFRAAGAKYAIPVLIVDIGKAVGVIWVGRRFGAGDLAPVMALPLVIGNL